RATIANISITEMTLKGNGDKQALDDPQLAAKFTLADREETEKRRAEIEALKISGNAHMPSAQKYFAKKAQEDGGCSKSAGVDNTADGTDNVDCTCQSERRHILDGQC
ncbi:hypothetical protein THAOC_31948, partial [Thalassiosira oceanica]